MQTITIKGITYTIVNRVTVEQIAAEGRINTAAAMKRNGQVAELTMRVGNGNNIYQCNELKGGRQVTKPLAIGKW